MPTEERFSDGDDHERSAHHLPASAEILDVGLDHIQQQRSVEWKVELLQVNKLDTEHTHTHTHDGKYQTRKYSLNLGLASIT